MPDDAITLLGKTPSNAIIRSSMAAAKFTAREIARRMGKPAEDVVAQLRSLGAEISDASEELGPEVIQALIAGKKLTARLRQTTFPPVNPSTQSPTERGTSSQQPEPQPLRPAEPRKSSQEASAGELLWTLRQIVDRERQQASDEVFIVHGHDTIKHAVSAFISSLSLAPIMLDEKPNRGQTIIEKLEQHAFTSFAVILLTPDDEGKKKGDPTLSPRARQNVVLELGFFLARLGRHRVCALYVPGVELPSDVQGLLYVELDSSGGWKYRLQQEMKAAGVPLRLPS